MDEREPQEWFTIREAQEYLRLSRSSIHKLTVAKKLPAYYIGATPRFKRSDLDRVPKRRRKR